VRKADSYRAQARGRAVADGFPAPLEEAFTPVRQAHEEPFGRNSTEGPGHVKKLSIEWFHGLVLMDLTARRPFSETGEAHDGERARDHGQGRPVSLALVGLSSAFVTGHAYHQHQAPGGQAAGGGAFGVNGRTLFHGACTPCSPFENRHSGGRPI
jgi:hypothetical protein